MKNKNQGNTNMKNMKKTKISQAMLGTLFLVASLSAAAQTEEVKKSSALVTSTTSAKVDTSNMEKVVVPGRLVQVGVPNEGAVQDVALKGFANELPLITVMKQITPNGWIVKKNDTPENKLDVQKPVSWQGGKNWIDTLKDVSSRYSLDILVNWNEKTITVSNSKVVMVPKVENKVAIFELEGTVTKDMTVGASEQKAEAPVVVTPVVVKETWELASGKSLKENVQLWAKKAGYRLVWLGEDYPIEDTRVLEGQFDSENGPIKQLSVDYGPDSRAQNPLSFQFYQNRTLVVENWMFEQTGYPQFNKKD